MSKYLFTSECVTPGHPDKICDQISDAILDAALDQDENARVAIETLVTTGQVIVAGEMTTSAYINIQDIVRSTIKRIGYNDSRLGFSYDCGVLNAIHEQSSDIALGVDTGGAGDQGMMFGGAVKETPELMPLPIALSRAITNQYDLIRRTDPSFEWARPDGKSQVTVIYEDGKPIGIDTIVMSVQHSPDISQKEIKQHLIDSIIGPVLDKYGFSWKDVRVFHINPTGRFVIGGPHGDSGVTGRKIIVDTYGGYFSHGGGAFSGKDPTKVDRSAAYMARYIAKNIVAAGLSDKCEVQLSYAIGIKTPVSINIKNYGTSTVPSSVLEKAVYEVFDMTPEGIINKFKLRKPDFSYEELAARGHFGRTDLDLPWERTDATDKLKKHVDMYLRT